VRPEGIAGLQIWLNLPAKEKMTAPKYRDLTADKLSESTTDEGAKVRAIAGETADGKIKGPVDGLAVAPKFVDVVLEPGAGFRDTLPFDHTAFAYVDHGTVFFGPEKTEVRGPQLVVFEPGDEVTAVAGPEGGRFLLAAARPLHEPIARYGPFVMNTRAEIEQTLRELQTGRFLRRDPKDVS